MLLLPFFLHLLYPGLAFGDALPSTNIPSKAHCEIKRGGIAWPWLAYKSSDQKPPHMKMSGNGKDLAEGYIFISPIAPTIDPELSFAKETGVFIMTTDGDLIYGHKAMEPTDFRKQGLNGKEYLTYWSGLQAELHGYGQVNILDSSYVNAPLNPDLGLVKITKTKNSDWSIDFHEHQMTDRNTILISAYNNTPADLSGIDGPENGWIVDSLVYELDIKTGKVLWNWKASDHVPFSASKQPFDKFFGNGSKAAPYDYFHINSIQAVGDNYLINARHTWTLYLVSRTGRIIWTFNGQNGGSFGAPRKDETFRWQHHVRAHNVTDTSADISIFDNHSQYLDNGTAPSRGLIYHLELPARKSSTPKLLRKVETTSEPLYAESQGSYDPTLSNGNQLLGYGQLAITREYGPGNGGDLRWEAQYGGLNQVQNYRSFKDTWHATPANWDPHLVVEKGQVYVSWNGATEVTGWSVYTGKQQNALKKVGVAKKKGFETTFTVPDGAVYIQVAAVQRGKEVRKSNVVKV